MTRHTTRTLLFTLLALFVLAQPALACMDHMDEEEWYMDDRPEEEEPESEPMPVAPRTPVPMIECQSDLECPSAMLCERVACLAMECLDGEPCLPCPEGLCVDAPEGAQGRDCQADTDCGAGFSCQNTVFDGCGDALGVAAEDCSTPLGWCEAMPSVDMEIHGTNIDRIIAEHGGCQGGSSHGLPISLALVLLAGAAMRRRITVSMKP